jgi:ElaB/YqjD/DUF883 family membrane-anchored ribosome-binding protein
MTRGLVKEIQMDETTGTGTGTGTGAADDAEGRFNRAKGYVGEKYGAAADAVKNRYTAIKGKVDEIDFEEVTEKVRGYVRSNPGKALLISVGVGFVVGMLLRRGRDED